MCPMLKYMGKPLGENLINFLLPKGLLDIYKLLFKSPSTQREFFFYITESFHNL